MRCTDAVERDHRRINHFLLIWSTDVVLRFCLFISPLFTVKRERVNKSSAVEAASVWENGADSHIDLFDRSVLTQLDLRPDLNARNQVLVCDRVEDEPRPQRIRGQEQKVATEECVDYSALGEVAD